MLPARRSLLLITALAAAGFAGWIAAFSLAPQTSARGSRVVVDREVSQLLEQLKQGNLDGQERQLLLERLLLLGRHSEAVLVLRPWLEQQPGSLSLRLLKNSTAAKATSARTTAAMIAMPYFCQMTRYRSVRTASSTSRRSASS